MAAEADEADKTKPVCVFVWNKFESKSESKY